MPGGATGSPRSRRFDHAIPLTRTLAEDLLRDAAGAPFRWPSHRTDLQVIGSYTRTIRPLANPASLFQALSAESEDSSSPTRGTTE